MARSPAWYRPSVSCSVRVSAAALAALLLWVAGVVLVPEPASAQVMNNPLHFPPRPPPPPKSPAPQSNAPMLVQATEIKYDYTNNSVAAVGNVQIYYGGATIEADEVIYDQKTKRLRAQGNVRLTEPDGKITYGQIIDLTDDYRDGFVDSLRLETPDDTRFAAARADRARGNYTVLQNGVYTACEPARRSRKSRRCGRFRPPASSMMRAKKCCISRTPASSFSACRSPMFRSCRRPTPPSNARAGFCFRACRIPRNTVSASSQIFLGAGAELRSDLGALVTTKQGPMFEGEWRQRLLDGSYSIRAAGIWQADPGYFVGRDGANSPTADSFRGAIQSAGQFAINDKWAWGWTGLLVTDTQFMYDYQLRTFTSAFDPFQTGVTSEAVSQLYLTGAGPRSYFDLRGMYLYGFSEWTIKRRFPSFCRSSTIRMCWASKCWAANSATNSI